MIQFFALLSLFISVKVSAAELKLVPNYECQLIVVVDEKSENMHEKFMADYASGSHGGREYRFNKGPQSVTVMASNNWMAIHWERAGQVIAEGHFAISKPSDFHRVILMLNPKNLDEQVSLDCSPESAE